MIDIFKQTLKKLFDKLDTTSDTIFLYDCIKLHPTMFLNEYRELMREELIKKGICPECKAYLIDRACQRCKILYDEV